MNYPGGKNGAGTFQFIINRIPPHKVYIEGFLGSGAILRNKQPAEINIGIDRDPEIITAFQGMPEYRYAREDEKNFYFLIADFIEYLDRIVAYGYEAHERFIYLDPPYLGSTRKQQRPIYKFEMMEPEQHIELLQLIRTRSEMIMISGYQSELYENYMHDWRSETFTAITRGGTPAEETIWMNYPEPTRLHDYGFLGKDYTDRQRIKRKIQRHVKKLAALPVLERAAILAALDDIDKSDYNGQHR